MKQTYFYVDLIFCALERWSHITKRLVFNSF